MNMIYLKINSTDLVSTLLAESSGRILEVGVTQELTPRIHAESETRQREVYTYDCDAARIADVEHLRTAQHHVRSVSSYLSVDFEWHVGLSVITNLAQKDEFVLSRIAWWSDYVVVIADVNDALPPLLSAATATFQFTRAFITSDTKTVLVLSNLLNISSWPDLDVSR